MPRPPRALSLLLVAAAATGVVALAAARPWAEDAPRSSGDVRSPAHGFSPGYEVLKASEGSLARDLDGMAATGAGWVRIDFDWSSVENVEGRFDWAAVDRVVAGARSRGMQVLALAAYTPAWARPPDSTDKHAPDDPREYAGFVQAAVERFAPLGVNHWEVWNEPNTDSFWQPAPDPEAYGRLLSLASRAIREVDPDAIVLMGGTAPAADAQDGSTISPTTFLRAIYDVSGSEAFDAVAHHPYSYPDRPLHPSPENAFAGTTPALRNVMLDHGDDDKLIWGTEYGAPTGTGDRAVTEAQQADHLVEALEAWQDSEYTGPLFWYSWRDAGPDSDDLEQNFGLVRLDHEPKPAVAALTRRIDEHCAADASRCR